jgi:predicted translin family RNA/ssDNA-binding protein
MTTFQPFVLISNKNNLKKIREWGFKTFHPYIDESYDELDTYKERKVLLEKEIERLCTMTIVELDEWYWSMQDILIHNHKHYVKFMKYQYSGVTDFINTAYNNLNEE